MTPPGQRRKRLPAGTLLALALLWSSFGAASSLFEDDGVIDLTLSGPLGSLLETKQNPTYLQFTLETGGTSVPVEIRVRGHSRLRICDFPPLRLRFPPDDGHLGIFGGQDRLRLVTHCRNHDRGEQDLLEEYAAYRVFNVTTPLSYRVRLLRVRYVDSGASPGEPYPPRAAFLVEPGAEFAARTGVEQVSLPGFPKDRHDRAHAALMYVLQYLIANTDWMLLRAEYDDACCHNADLFERDSRILFVPYDFDLSGLVNARYAHPDPRLRISRVTHRRYRGLCTDRRYLSAALADVVSKREPILDAVRTVPGLNRRNAGRAERYLEDFFERAGDPERLLRSFERHCLERY